MQKIGNYYLLSEAEMDDMNYSLDLFFKYKAMSELNWEEQRDEETMRTDI